MPMSKIAIDARMYGKGVSGIGTYIKNLTDHLFQLTNSQGTSEFYSERSAMPRNSRPDSRTELNSALPGKQSKIEFYIFLLPENYQYLDFPYSNVHKIKTDCYWYTLKEQTRFVQELNKYNFDLVHFPNFNAPIFYNKPRIHTIHDITPVFFPGHKQKSWLRRQAYLKTIKTSLNKSSKIITISNNSKNDIIKYFKINPEKITVTYLGIEKNFHQPENYAKIKEVTDKYNITKPYIFYISAWRNHKNFQGLIKAFEILKFKYKKNYQLVLGGKEDPYYLDISHTITKSPVKDDILTPGFIPDKELPLIYNGADIFALPSFYEGFGIIGLEAMACSTPVVSSNAACLPEILGDAAVYFNPQKTEEIAAKINKVISNQNLKNDLINKGLEQIKKYSWQNCTEQTLNIYNSLINTDNL